jgi:hypothetical protein
MPESAVFDAEARRLLDDARREKNWKRWGPYLAERQWGTVREDYSADGTSWDYFPHDHARSRAYRWGEDGLLGITDRECRLCFALALWNTEDPILKERLFGLTGPEGNHGEDVKEVYFYIDSTPTHSYLKAQYKYPYHEFPYTRLVDENRRRGNQDREFELLDTGIFDGDHYFDITAEYAKASPDDILIRLTIANPGPDLRTIHVLPTLWCRNTWSWGRKEDGYWPRPTISADGAGMLVEHATLGRYRLAVQRPGELLFTDNETNARRIFNYDGPQYAKDAFHEYVIHGRQDAVNPARTGTKAAVHYTLPIAPGQHIELHLRLSAESENVTQPFGTDFGTIFDQRIAETDAFYQAVTPDWVTPEQRAISRQAYAGLLWSKQYFHYVVLQWLQGDPAQPVPPAARWHGRNSEWLHVFNRDVLSMPDKWEYPWFAAWDLAFHMLPFARIDPAFAKEQLVLLLREWYMHPNGQLPAYEFAFSDANPPVHAWACWRVYKISAPKGQRDRAFLERTFQKLLFNFAWWVNRKDIAGRQVFGGGFLGLDNIGMFDRSKPLPSGQALEQADGTAWMAFYCTTMLAMAMELAKDDPVYEDVASKFFEHFIEIADAMNTLGGDGLWDDTDGFYYDELLVDGQEIPLRVRSAVGWIPLFAVTVLEQEIIDKLPGFRKRMDWFLANRKDLFHSISWLETNTDGDHTHRLLAIPTREKLIRVLHHLLDENEFLSPYGMRSLSKYHQRHPFSLDQFGDGRVDYEPAESTSGIFGGNSNWRGPIWFPINYLLIESLERYAHFYGDTLRVECPTGSGKMMTLREVAFDLTHRLSSLFTPDSSGRSAWQGENRWFADNPNWRGLTWFFEFFCGDTGRGLGANHQTGWTALITRCLEDEAWQNQTARPT